MLNVYSKPMFWDLLESSHETSPHGKPEIDLVTQHSSRYRHYAGTWTKSLPSVIDKSAPCSIPQPASIAATIELNASRV